MEKKMFRYYQTEERGSWFPITDADDIESQAVGKGARKLTILAVGELVDDETTDKLDLAYRGPLYFDIDVKDENKKGDIAAAIPSAQSLVDRLLAKGVSEEDIRVYCSGSKGFHVLVNQKVFSNGRPQKRLPWIYREMALALFVAGMDFQVYSTGRGNSFRIPAVQREDGRYRTPITIDELFNLTPELYAELCSEPRSYKHPAWGDHKAVEMEALYEGAKVRAGKRITTAGAVEDAQLKVIAREAPNCMKDLADFKTIAADKSFNAIAMQLGILIARSGMDVDTYQPQLDRLAENSSTGNTSVAGRREELLAQVRYMQANKRYQFSCAGMRDLLSKRPCEGCPLEAAGAVAGGRGNNLGLDKRTDGYYYIGERSETRISTFTLTPSSVVIDRPQDGSAPRRAYTIMDVEVNGQRLGEISFSEAGWKSASNFKDELSGIKNLAFMGSDDHVQRIKHMAYSEEDDVAGEIMQVYTAGIHIEERLGQKIFTYVEPSYSINNVRVEDTYRLRGRILCPPYLASTKVCPKNDKEADNVLSSMLRMNSPLNISLTLGWFVACHLKAHFVDMYNQFPILSVWGNAGSGKSKTVEVMSSLCGTDPVRDTPVNISTPTAYAVLEYASSTTTIPRVMEEYNKSKMPFKAYTMVGEILKAAWGGETIAKGTLAKRSNQAGGRTGATVEAIKVTAPLVTVSEQAPEMPALVHRSIQIMFKQSDLRDKEDFFYEARDGMPKLRQIGKFLMLTALCNTRESHIRELMLQAKDIVPRKMDERPRFTMQVIWTSLQWFRECCVKMGLNESVSLLDDIILPRFLTHIEYLNDALERGKMQVHTEIDSVIESMAMMAALTYQGKDFLHHGKHFITTDDHIYIETATCHLLYKKFRNDYEREIPVISTLNQFTTLLRTESYYEGEEYIQEITKVRTCAKLNKRIMLEKGLNITMFEEE